MQPFIRTTRLLRACSLPLPRAYLFTGHVQRSFADVSYGPDAWLVFGRESRGLDEAVMQRFESACVRIPMRDGMRSLNLSNSVAIAAYEALRQQNWPGLA